MYGKRTPIEASAQSSPMARAALPLWSCVVAPWGTGDRRFVPVRSAYTYRIGNLHFSGRDSSLPADFPHSHADLPTHWDSAHVDVDGAARTLAGAFCDSHLVAYSAARAYPWGRGDAERGS